jgi:catechol 2,3-dioxygenase-like lactoylglutathione lyase family enzyme
VVIAMNTINHVSVNAIDIEASIAFYIDLFGQESCERIPTPNFGIPVAVQWLRIGDRELHLFELKELPIASRFCHFAIAAADLDQFHRITFVPRRSPAWTPTRLVTTSTSCLVGAHSST